MSNGRASATAFAPASVGNVAVGFDVLGLSVAAPGQVLTAFAITFGALMLGLAIAFGLGGRDAAKQLLERRVAAKKERDMDAAHHL